MTEEYNHLTSEQDIEDKEIESFILQNIPWKAAKGSLDSVLDLSEKYSHREDSYWIGSWLQEASLMREFDSERFDKEIEIKDDVWEKLFKEANYRIENGYYSKWCPKDYSTQAARLNPVGIWSFLSSLKFLNPENFAQNVKIPEKHWDQVTTWLKEKIQYDDVYWFMSVYKKAQIIDAQKITEQVPISENFWNTIKEALLEKPLASDIAIAQKIKPEGFLDIKIPQEVWQDHMRAIKSFIEEERARDYTFRIIQFAKILKNKEVEVESLET